MKKIIIIISSILLTLAIAAGIIIAIVLNNKGNNGDYRNIKIEYLSENNGVDINRSNEKIEAYKGMFLKSGDNLTTKENSYSIIKLDEDKYIRIGENSNIDIVSSEHDKTLTRIRVNEGSIVTEVKNKLSNLEEFEIETPNTAMSIRGTTFGVDVKKLLNEYEITYKLIEGSIEVRILENNIDTLDISKFVMNPMEEIKVLVKDSAIIEKDDLTNFLDKYRSNDNTIKIKEYTDVNDFISKTEKIILVPKKLEIIDITNELKSIPQNHDENTIRLVSVSSTFSVSDNNVNELIKYEQTTSYEVTIKAIEKEGYVVNKWLVNGNEVDGTKENEITINVTESMLVEPVYEELYETTVNASTYLDNVSVNGNLLTKETSYKKSKLNLRYYETTNKKFIGWYKIENDKEVLLSEEYEYEYIPTSSTTVEAKIIDLYITYVIPSGIDGFVSANNETIISTKAVNYIDKLILEFNGNNNVIFDGWYILNGNDFELLSKDNTYTYIPEELNSTIKAEYRGLYNTTITLEDYNVDVLVDTYKLTEEKIVEEQYSISLEFNDKNKVFIGWYIVNVGGEDTLLSSDKNYLYVPTDDKTITAKYRNPYTTTITATDYTNNITQYVSVNGTKLTKEISIKEDGNNISLSFVTYKAKFLGWYLIDSTEEVLLSNLENYSYKPNRSATILCKFAYYYDVNITASSYDLDNISVNNDKVNSIKTLHNQTSLNIKYEDVSGYTYLGIYKLDDNVEEVELLTTEKEYTLDLTSKMTIKIKFIQNPHDDVKASFYPVAPNGLPISSSTKYSVTGEAFSLYDFNFMYSLGVASPTAVQIAEIKAEDASELIEYSIVDACGLEVNTNNISDRVGIYYVTYWLKNEPSIIFNDALIEVNDSVSSNYTVTTELASATAKQYVHINGLGYSQRASLTNTTKVNTYYYISFGNFSRELSPTLVDNIIFLGFYSVDENDNKTLLTFNTYYEFIPQEDMKIYVDYAIYDENATPKLTVYNDGTLVTDEINATPTSPFNWAKLTFKIESDESQTKIDLPSGTVTGIIYDENDQVVNTINYSQAGRYKLVVSLLDGTYTTTFYVNISV